MDILSTLSNAYIAGFTGQSVRIGMMRAKSSARYIQRTSQIVRGKMENLYKKYKYEDIGGAIHNTVEDANISSIVIMLCLIFGNNTCLYVDEILMRGMIKHNLIDVDKIVSMYSELLSTKKSVSKS